MTPGVAPPVSAFLVRGEKRLSREARPGETFRSGRLSGGFAPSTAGEAAAGSRSSASRQNAKAALSSASLRAECGVSLSSNGSSCCSSARGGKECSGSVGVA